MSISRKYAHLVTQTWRNERPITIHEEVTIKTIIELSDNEFSYTSFMHDLSSEMQGLGSQHLNRDLKISMTSDLISELGDYHSSSVIIDSPLDKVFGKEIHLLHKDGMVAMIEVGDF